MINVRGIGIIRRGIIVYNGKCGFGVSSSSSKKIPTNLQKGEEKEVNNETIENPDPSIVKHGRPGSKKALKSEDFAEEADAHPFVSEEPCAHHKSASK